MTTEQISESNSRFLEKVQSQAGLTDLYEARDLCEVVFRTMRDVMTTEAADRVTKELHTEAQSASDDKSLQTEVATLWKDTNPIVAWLSRIRPPLNIDDQLFVRRIEQEGGMPRGTSGEAVIEAVFSATKDELSQERIQEISQSLPGKIQEIWLRA
ncbi:MAG: DUF2267 domain-containing protein [Oscillatoriales cyanobacterium RM2_1_1]|nr:DUF2267 domain-containing protein [Oscillatoriales cyanobacterium SM2_3_0]NJO44838.1 DUF2267 domain-containing protein [Oscillatoriales cyanobacterium RM2_1_1]